MIIIVYCFLIEPRSSPSSLLVSFIDLTEFQFIFKDHNQLTSLDANLFASLTNLEVLDLSKNKMKLYELFINLTEFHFIFKDGNQLTSLDANLFASLKNLTTLTLSKNNTKLNVYYSAF
jgi:Leucine-rich repeat (LRR) protein